MPCIGDIEASGLSPESYPIEIAWSLPDGTIHSNLIQTHETWGDYWDPDAEAMHHITREMLREQGLPAIEVAQKMNTDLAGETIYFDGGNFDEHWLARLYRAAGMKPLFKTGTFVKLLALTDAVGVNHWVVAEALARVDIGALPRHRAAHDVTFLQCWYLRARDGWHR